MILAKIQHWFETKTGEAGNTLFAIKTIGELEKSCCPESITRVIDFDAVKEWYIREHRMASIASVDGLFLDTNHDDIYFIEMKGWQKFLKYHSPVVEADIEVQAGKFDFGKKFRDSLQILVNISACGEMPVEEREIHTVAKYFVLLTDIRSLLKHDPLLNFMANMNMLSLYSSHIRFIEEKTDEALSVLKAVRYNHINLQPPVRLDCSNIDDFLQNRVNDK